MQRAEDQVTGLCRRERQTDRLEVSHLAHQNNVRVFPER